ncbi:MAG: hypothetical protein F4052_08705 [Dehalococcoidia bacterium]|nr:hypothetical protein [Dehalococcoidia bacterium]MYK27003.1 hypothetical protein [Dehalococcoidia bacterium]
MVSFDLHLLGWRDFQQLCHTVTREVLGQTVVSFLDSNDAGRDGAFFGRWRPSDGESYEGNFVIQAKHTALPNKSLTLSLIADELEKAERLVESGLCDVYVLMSNAKLTGESERKIRDAFISRGVKQVLILGDSWFNQTISESGRLRMLVPRLYGLGDLTQILDERAYGQAAAVLDSMRTDLAKLVRTETYERAAQALDEHGFVLLSGAPMTGKTTIAAELALAAADHFQTRVVALQDAAELPERWNPNENQFFWLDDAFGATQLNQYLASSWQRVTPRVKAAIDSGSKFVLTTRDYVLRSAWPHLKPGAFPLLEGARVVVDVADLTPRERQQILYNHLKHGRQDTQFLTQLQPHLDGLASHAGFRPELARRLAEPTFTASMGQPTAPKLERFFEQPLEMLEAIFRGLDTDSQAALGLLFLSQGWLSSPIKPDDRGAELMSRLGASLGGVTRALGALSGSLVTVVTRDSDQGYEFAHPTMADAYARLLREPEFLHLLIGGFTIDALLNQTTCGDMGVENALVIPQHLWPVVMERLGEPDRGPQAWRRRVRREHYLAYQCVADFQLAYFERCPDLLDSLAEPGLMLESDPHNAFVATLHRNGVLPEAARRRFASRLIEFCIEGTDPAVLWASTLRALLNDDEERVLLHRLREEVISDPRNVVKEFTSQHSDSEDPEDFSFPLDQLADALERELPGNVDASAAAARMRDLRMEWVASHKPHRPADATPTETYKAEPSISVPVSTERSVFDDLVPS